MSKLYVLNGLDMGRCFQLKEGANSMGRSFENDITLQDETVSRQHLRIEKKADRYFATDLESKNGTFFGGKYLLPETEFEVKEGVPIAIGMTMIAIGEVSMTLTKPFLESVGLTEETGEKSGIFIIHKDKTNQKKLETLYRVSDLLEQKLPLKETLDKELDVLAELLVEIDSTSIILVDPSTTKIVLFSHRSRKSEGRPAPKISLQVLYQVIKGKKTVMISNSDTEAVNPELASTLKMHGISSVMCVPMICDSQVWGVIYLHSLKKPYGFTPEDVCLFEEIAQRTDNYIQYGQYFSELSRMMDGNNTAN
ncbi:MAG TPA: FHA domain-containing protein [Thermodesulfovibrionales bacterium]|nr:FHA domain-containing protein [Thermodesulfovibrionales bacterium]